MTGTRLAPTLFSKPGLSRNALCRIPVGVLILFVSLCAQSAGTDEINSQGNPDQSSIRFLTGKAVAAGMEEMAGWSAEGVSLQSQLENWQTQARIRVIRDRRLDPNQIVQLSSMTGNRARMLDALVEDLSGTGWVLQEDYVYFAPVNRAFRLPALMEIQRKVIQEVQKKMTPADSSQVTVRLNPRWQRLSSPRNIVLSSALDIGLVIENPNVIPHDLWDRDSWPAMTFGEQTTLILNQFDLMLQPSDIPGSLRVTPVDWSFQAEVTYAFPVEQRSAIEAAARDIVPGAKIRWARGNARVIGSLRDHLWFRRRLNETQFGAKNTGELTESLKTRIFTLTVDRASLRAVIANFEQNGITVQVTQPESEAVQSVLQQSVSVMAVGQPGSKFFAELFGDYFNNIQVLDDRVVVSNPR